MPYNIKRVRYTDVYGALLWEDTMVMSRLDAVGEDMIREYVRYTVIRVAVDGDAEIVNLEVAKAAEEHKRHYGA